ncbi:hypothetical protein KP509_01G038600 [Ceratopteris richardii]|uniref:Nucleotide-diphospho-sugar transferase domain-containing protein n=1 Tax=Ceratopteris richardii TaxID=49495 RepID=A0A8T2VC83_CERRI|nr:hypothetical protein KP509_01G038600 [Ceratopteris richardii]
MGRTFTNPHCRWIGLLSVRSLPSIIFATLIFGVLYARISLLSIRSPLLAACGDRYLMRLCKSRKALSNLSFTEPNVRSLTIFTAPLRPFSDSPDDPQYQALLSWLSLRPTPRIVLLVQVHSIFARAQQEDTDFSMIIDPHSFLFQDTMEALYRTHYDYEKWALFGKTRDIGYEVLNISFTITGEPGIVKVASTVSGSPKSCEEISKLVVSHGYLNGPISFWAWNNLHMNKTSAGRFLHEQILPFSYLRGTFEEWISRKLSAESTSNRVVIDASEAMTSVRINLSNISASIEEWSINKRLSAMNDFTSHSASYVAPLKLMRCAEPESEKFCLDRQEETFMVMKNVNDQQTQIPTEESNSSGIDVAMKVDRFYTLDNLLPLMADEAKLVFMVGCTSNYKEMLLSFICRAKYLGIPNVLIVAFDEALYDFAYLQGLPVYLENSADQYKSFIDNDRICVFGSECFKRVSKLKSMSVLKVLKKGYSVLWSDIDIVWFENPLPHLLAFRSGALVIQSDEPDENLPENSILGMNSGFYLARSDEKTIHAFEAIVGHAMKSNKTEQPSFYAVLCGEKGERRVGERECAIEEHNGLHTVFLGHRQFPNGHVFLHWDSGNATKSCEEKECILLHNNFIAGKENKLKRFVVNDLWFYDVRNRMCIQPWHPSRSGAMPLSVFQTETLASLNITEPTL